MSDSRDSTEQSDIDEAEVFEKVRPYDGWWWKAAEVPAVDVKTGELAPIVGWVPFSVLDNDRLERGLASPELCEFPDETVVHDDNGQRMYKVNLSKMEMSALYWAGPSRPVRRCIWMQMKSAEDINGGNPVPGDWDKALEAAYQENEVWLKNQDSGGHVVEKIVSLPEPLSTYVLVLRQGTRDAAKLVSAKKFDKAAGLISSGIFERDRSVRLIRGYTPYHIMVMSAIQKVQSEKSKSGSKSPVPSTVLPLTLPSPFEPPLLEEIPAPKELVFAVHGIGQKFAGRFGTNFVYDCDCLRARICQAVTQRGGRLDDIILLPINWRLGLKMGIRSWFPESKKKEDEPFEELVARITLDTIPAIRDVASDVGLDILLYMTPAYFKRILDSALCEIRRQYRIFLKANGPGAASTKVSFIGHSLGSAIVSDLLSFIAEEDSNAALTRSALAVFRNLGFPVNRFFAIGSPLAMFFLLKQLKPKACLPDIHDMYKQCTAKDLERAPGEDENDFYPSLPEPTNSREFRPRDVYFACREMYNIFHPYDPIAYRLEPLVVPPEEMIRFTRPVLLPYCKRGALHLKRQMEDGVQEFKDKAAKAKDDLVSSMAKTFNVLPEWLRASIGSPAECQMKSIDGTIEASATLDATTRPPITTHPALMLFNRHGRIDFSIEEALFENAYISAISSHVSYWDDIDVANFLAVEIGGLSTKSFLDAPR